ncbi:MAG: hypothetical protein TH68_04105 [Candidatus Synechococcus spongiarum 142]|uniref:DUF4435 domain-containing protein n=1 Tax=Candidatus Synechococcus spongiarum 142 TaxID=1608213 RepID=A0A6N3X8Y4_9SYNE|nr:MAG: hypothetical protein TH68_04105 [Candidatus Synechococcus spongiarum 142]
MMSNLQKRILLVEGDDDKHFVKNFCCRRLSKKLVCKFADENEENNSNNDNDNDNDNSNSVLYIDSRSRKEGGIKNMIGDMPLKIKETGREAVGILADANGYSLDSCEHPWQRIKTKLEEVLTLEERLPGKPCQKGLILPNVTPKQKPKSTIRIGVWLMPDNESNGELENFFASLIDENNLLWTCAKEYINQCIESMEWADNQRGGFDTGKPYKISKAEVYAWLATRKKPGKMGAAISQDHGFNFDSELAQRFALWLEELFCF